MFSVPEDNLNHLTLREGMTTADFGTGSGFYAVAMGKRVGPRGVSYAIDVQKEMLPHVSDAATRAGVMNVKPIWGVIDEVGGTKLHDKTCDAIVISNVLFQSENKEATAMEAARLLKPGGEVLVIDWSSAASMGPHQDSVVSKEKAVEYFTNVGLDKIQDFDAGSHHYGLVFKKK